MEVKTESLLEDNVEHHLQDSGRWGWWGRWAGRQRFLHRDMYVSSTHKDSIVNWAIVELRMSAHQKPPVRKGTSELKTEVFVVRTMDKNI